jgi:ATP phosphoribosyltransferase regulatory subunit HisZ
MFDEHGEVLTLRWDMTVPIARLVATPLRDRRAAAALRYFAVGLPRRAPAARSGARAAAGRHRARRRAEARRHVEALTILCRALDAVGLRDYRIGLGSASLYPRLMDDVGVPDALRDELLGFLARRDMVGLGRRVDELGLDERLVTVPQLRGGEEVLERASVEPLRAVWEGLGEDVRRRVIFDLGLVRQLGYYTGAVFEVYDPALGTPIGRGGRYDDLLGRFGRPLPAVGFALQVDRVHQALTGEERR